MPVLQIVSLNNDAEEKNDIFLMIAAKSRVLGRLLKTQTKKLLNTDQIFHLRRFGKVELQGVSERGGRHDATE
jgi:hypothetical protein